MTALNLGVNSEGISYEVALEVLGQSRQPLMTAIREEREKVHPSLTLIRYCESRLAAIDEIQDELAPGDVDTIQRILSLEGERNIFKTQLSD